jgi:hypothetical protein
MIATSRGGTKNIRPNPCAGYFFLCISVLTDIGVGGAGLRYRLCRQWQPLPHRTIIESHYSEIPHVQCDPAEKK